jgi:hypothetical protein
MTRDNGEQSTRPDAIDFDSIGLEDDAPNHRSGPSIVPDHGRQPRRPERPSKVDYDEDRQNTYRPDNDPFLRSLRDAETMRDDRRIIQQRLIIRALVKTAKSHAPKLARYRDDVIPAMIERELMSGVRFIAESLPADAQAGAVDKFVEILWEEIALHRHASRRRDRSAKNAVSAKSIT